MKYLAGPYRAERANLRGNHLTAGMPAPSAFLGLAGAVARDLGLDGWRLSVLPVLHQVHTTSGRTRGETVLAGVRTSRCHSLEIMEDVTGLVEFSMLLDLSGAPEIHEVEDALLTRQFAGSPLFEAGWRDGATVHEVNADAPLRAVPRGRILVPAVNAPVQVSFGDRAGLTGLTEILYPRAGPGRDGGWLVPVAAGYRLLETPAQAGARRASRSPDHPHAFAEPAVGVGELISSRKPGVARLMGGLDALAWRWAVDAGGDHAMFHPRFLAAVQAAGKPAEESQAT